MMKKRKEFNNILDECLERVLIKGETVEQCLASYPEQAAELEPLLQTALATKKASAIKPRPEFRDRARYQFRSALQEMEVERGRRFFSWQPRWATAVIAILVLLLASGGTVAAANNSMPDEPLYPVKLATERVRLALTPSALGKAELYINLADKRVAEMVYMANKGKPEQVERAAQRLDTYLTRVASLTTPPQEAGALLVPAPEKALAPVSPDMGPRRGGGEVTRDGKRARLRAILVRHAVENPEALQAALGRVPESAKPALRRAIDVSDTGYKKALKALD